MILVVEDDLGVATLERRRLERAGYRVTHAARATEAMQCLREQAIALIVLDNQLPDMQGIEFYSQLKQNGYQIPVIVVTGAQNEVTVIQALRAGVRDYVVKSSEYLDYLPEAVARVLRQVETERALDDSRKQLERSLALLANAQQIAGIGSWEWSIARNSIVWSDELYRIYGIAHHELKPTFEGFLERVHEDDRARVRSAVEGALAGDTYDVEHRIVRPTGEIRTVRSRGRVLVDATAHPAGMEGTEQDITDMKRAEAKLTMANRDLETLLHVTSHDLREPLRAVESFAQLVTMRYADALDELGRDYLRRIAGGASRMRDLLDAIVELARARALSGVVTPIDGDAVVREVMERLAQRVAETRAHVVVSADLPALWADRFWAVEALVNLVDNALKFVKPGVAPEIEIAPHRAASDSRAQGARGSAGIVVRDRGRGVEPEHAERIFDFFQRAVGRDIEGTGAGLAIVREVARRHGGDAWVSPREGGGAEFTVTFGQPGASS